MAAKIKAAIPSATVELVRGKGGDFKVDADGVRLWDKRKMDDEFPEDGPMIANLELLARKGV